MTEDVDVNRVYKWDGRTILRRIVANLVRTQIRLITFMKICIQYRNTYYLLLAPHQENASIPYATCAFRSEHLQSDLEPRLEEDHSFERNVNGQLIPVTTDKPPALFYFLQDMKCSCEKPNRGDLLCTGVVALKLVYRVFCCANIMGIVKTTTLYCNLLYHLVILENLFYFDPKSEIEAT